VAFGADPTPIADSSIIQRLLGSRRLLRAFVVRRFRTRYRQSMLDIAWSLLTPIVVMAIYGLILSSAFDVTGDGVPYITFAWTGVVIWTFFASSLGEGVASIVGSSDLISKIYFPRESLPLAAVGASCIDLAIGMVIAVVLAVVQGVRFHPTIVAVVVPLGLLVLWTAVLAVFSAVINVFVRDASHALSLILRVGFFASPVMYPVSKLPHQLRWTATVSPVAVSIEAVRDALLRGRWPDWPVLAIHGVVAGGLFFAVIAYTRAIESRMVDVI